MDQIWDNLAMLIDKGGPIMVALLVMSVVSLSLILERVIFWRSMRGRLTDRRIATLNEAFRTGDEDRVKKMIQRDRSPFGIVAHRLLESGTNESVAVEAVEQQRPRLERFMVSLSTIITAAPLLGILGTVIGIIQSFELIGEQSTLTDPRAVSAGIATALLTTALGLIVALVTLFPYMIFRGQVSRAIGRLESLIAAAQHGERNARTSDAEASRIDSDAAHRHEQSPSHRGTPQSTAASAVS